MAEQSRVALHKAPNTNKSYYAKNRKFATLASSILTLSSSGCLLYPDATAHKGGSARAYITARLFLTGGQAYSQTTLASGLTLSQYRAASSVAGSGPNNDELSKGKPLMRGPVRGSNINKTKKVATPEGSPATKKEVQKNKIKSHASNLSGLRSSLQKVGGVEGKSEVRVVRNKPKNSTQPIKPVKSIKPVQLLRATVSSRNQLSTPNRTNSAKHLNLIESKVDN